MFCSSTALVSIYDCLSSFRIALGPTGSFYSEAKTCPARRVCSLSCLKCFTTLVGFFGGLLVAIIRSHQSLIDLFECFVGQKLVLVVGLVGGLEEGEKTAIPRKEQSEKELLEYGNHHARW